MRALVAYGRYLLLPLILLVTGWRLVLGGPWPWIGFLFALVVVSGGDRLLGEDTSTPALRSKRLLNVFLYLNAPLLLALLGLLAMRADALNAPGWAAPLHGAGWLSRVHFDDPITPLGWVGAVFSVGLMAATAGINVGHELVHRTWNPAEVTLGRWLLATCGDAAFSIEHVHGHHSHVGTPRDPATALRGETVYAFIPRSTFGQLASAWRIERDRLARRGRGILTPHNRLWRGFAMSALIATGMYLLGGFSGVLLFALVAVTGKTFLEIINYVEHYGLVRVPGQPVLPRHSWNSNAALSMSALYNLPRHSHHHANSSIPYWGLQPMPGAPEMPAGYMSMLLAALIPPYYRRLMAPRLAEWDARLASAEERALLAGAPAA